MTIEKTKADQSRDAGSADIGKQYLSAPAQLKNQVRAAIGATNDDEAMAMIAADPGAAQAASEILSSGMAHQSLLAGAQAKPKTAPEDVLYPRS